ncbi:hypothetical protein PoB_004533100 [Plakobranchus ocellatus]|uniref:Uncharacterized protein n=1 Tax=Plakobranchus ocellatus TaxID=259542 RepID=A0AAV4BIR3_9GAST|nr:hypothetical protein PoB_004533100 [Plakobranchus ocellatus]
MTWPLQSVSYLSSVFETKDTRVEIFDREFSLLTRTIGKNPTCTTGPNTVLKTWARPGELCTPGTVAVIFNYDWSVQDFFSRTAEARPCPTRWVRIHYAHSLSLLLCSFTAHWVQQHLLPFHLQLLH